MSLCVIEGSLEVKLPTIWTDEKQSRAEAERRERLEERRSEKRKSQKKEDADAQKGSKYFELCSIYIYIYIIDCIVYIIYCTLYIILRFIHFCFLSRKGRHHALVDLAKASTFRILSTNRSTCSN